MSSRSHCFAMFVFSTFAIGACSPMPFNDNAIVVYASLETTPVKSAEDAADDPAIWINSDQPESSLILGTDKKSGLAVYNLQGTLVQFLDRGRLNNVDIRQAVNLNDGTGTLAVATNRSEKSLDLFSISDQGEVRFIFAQPLDFVDPYGVCMSADASGNAYAFVNDKAGAYQQWHLNPEGDIKPQLIGQFSLTSQPEGCAVDDTTQRLYLGEENHGIWMMPANAHKASEIALLDSIESNHLTADVEGMDVYRQGEQAWLIVSSQGDFSYALYDLNQNNQFVGSIRIADNTDLNIDGAEETDGLAVTSANLGGGFSQGLLVVQDGFNRRPNENQNFKLVAWQQVAKALEIE